MGLFAYLAILSTTYFLALFALSAQTLKRSKLF